MSRMMNEWSSSFMNFDQNLSYNVYSCSQVKLHRWGSFNAVCSLESNVTTIKAGGSTLVFQHTISALLTQCGNCTRRSCIVAFHLSSPEGQMISPHNHIFLSSPRYAEGLQKPNITVRTMHSHTIYKYSHPPWIIHSFRPTTFLKCVSLQIEMLLNSKSLSLTDRFILFVYCSLL